MRLEALEQQPAKESAVVMEAEEGQPQEKLEISAGDEGSSGSGSCLYSPSPAPSEKEGGDGGEVDWLDEVAAEFAAEAEAEAQARATAAAEVIEVAGAEAFEVAGAAYVDGAPTGCADADAPDAKAGVEETAVASGAGPGQAEERDVAIAEPVIQPEKRRKVAPAGKVVRLNTSPQILASLSPLPWCTISLNHNDHRWSAKWRADISCEFWIDELQNKTHSKSFVASSESSWKEALRVVHERVWAKWMLNRGKLPLRMDPQTPGEIPEEALRQLSGIVSTLPEAKVYAR